MPKIVTDADRQLKRRAILDAAAVEIAQYGYDRANINTIAERAGIGRGTIYLYFASKDEVLDALLDTIGSLIDETVRTGMADELPWPARLRALSHAFVTLASAHRDFFRVHVSALHGVNRAIGAPMSQWLAISVHRLTQTLQAGMDAGQLLPMPADTLAMLILGALESLALLPDALQQSTSADAERAETLATLLWRGIAPA
jgi:TetR/AcrR family fatty acid metabolism transcriptional regulator